jgi:tetratricopeptide (TPR) repeat protein
MKLSTPANRVLIFLAIFTASLTVFLLLTLVLWREFYSPESTLVVPATASYLGIDWSEENVGPEIANAKAILDKADSDEELGAVAHMIAVLESTEDEMLLIARDYYLKVVTANAMAQAKEKERYRRDYEESRIKVTAADSEIKRFHALTNLTRAAYRTGELEAARTSAEEVLKSADNYRNNWNYGNAVHKANTTLGLLAVADGAIDLAKRHLDAAGKTPGSPQLNSFGPSMALAGALHEEDEDEAVLAYLEQCAIFWDSDRGRLAEWAGEIRAGETPGFGSQ